MTAWGVAPARGHLCLCGTCGSVVAFHEEHRLRPQADAEASRVTLAVNRHFQASAACRAGGTFEGREVVACRCRRPMRLPRPEGLFCARCEGRVAPEVSASSRRRRKAAPNGGVR